MCARRLLRVRTQTDTEARTREARLVPSLVPYALDGEQLWRASLSDLLICWCPFKYFGGYLILSPLFEDLESKISIQSSWRRINWFTLARHSIWDNVCSHLRAAMIYSLWRNHFPSPGSTWWKVLIEVSWVPVASSDRVVSLQDAGMWGQSWFTHPAHVVFHFQTLTLPGLEMLNNNKWNPPLSSLKETLGLQLIIEVLLGSPFWALQFIPSSFFLAVLNNCDYVVKSRDQKDDLGEMLVHIISIISGSQSLVNDNYLCNPSRYKVNTDTSARIITWYFGKWWITITTTLHMYSTPV